MIEVETPPGRRVRGEIGVNPQQSGLNSNSTPWYLSFQNFYSKEIYEYLLEHPGSTLSEIQRGCGCKLHYNHRGSHWENLLKIADTLEILCFFKYLKKERFRFFPTKKKPIVCDPPRTFERNPIGPDGLPRTKPTDHATMPLYARPEPTGSNEVKE